MHQKRAEAIMDKTITFDCQTKMVNLYCEDCIVHKECTLHETIEKETYVMQPKILCRKPSQNQSMVFKMKKTEETHAAVYDKVVKAKKKKKLGK